MNNKLFDTFLFVARRLNQELKIRPLLYGSLGLELITNHEFNPQDIDVLIPEEFIGEHWDEFLSVMLEIGCELVDLHEHEFLFNNIRIAFARIEELKQFAGINSASIRNLDHEGIEYKLLTLEQYLSVYKRSSTDGYRKNHKNKKDSEKIELIERILRIEILQYSEEDSDFV